MRGACLLLTALAATATTAATPATAGADTGGDLVRWYGAPAHYREVRRDVLGWHKTTRNGCVAFASTALRHVGVAVPERGYVRRITLDFSRFLEGDLGWVRVADPRALAPGDLVFTTDADCCPGYPAHVFVVASWVSRPRLVVRAIDNRGLGYTRPLAPAPGDDTSAFAYALRAPADAR